jgi:putative nucleotidyltransferase with HDIG domain
MMAHSAQENRVIKDRIQRIERYVKRSMSTVSAPDLRIAHDYQHVDRVRRWALRIASGEAIQNTDVVQAAALLHDIGLTRVTVEQRGQHAQVGAQIAGQFLREHQMFSEEEIEIITDAIRCHSSTRGGGRLGEVLRDADKLDALGAVGIMRACTSNYAKPEYDPQAVKGETWGMPMTGFEARFASGKGVGGHIIDQINFQISFYDGLHTETAIQLGQPLVEFMRAYVIQLGSEIRRSQ